MPKKFKVKTYEKDNDDHYVVVLNPWTKGYKQRCQEQVNWMGAWLRIAFGKPKEKNIVKNIYTVDTRSDVIARISASVDVGLGLGLHRWEEFMTEDHLRRIRQQSGVDLSGNVSHIFPYNWTLHGDPAEREFTYSSQWKEWFPRQDEIPPSIMIRMDYPEPEWSEIPPVDGRLRSLLLPLPVPAIDNDLSMTADLIFGGGGAVSWPTEHNPRSILPKQEEVKATKKDGRIDGLQTSTESAAKTASYSCYKPPLHFPEGPQPEKSTGFPGAACSSGKRDKLDPYEEDDKAQALLSTAPVKQEAVERVKLEAEVIKPNVQDAEVDYRPSDALSNAVSELRGDRYSRESDYKPVGNCEEEMDAKPNVRSTEYRPSDSLSRAVSKLRKSFVPSEQEDEKPVTKQEGYDPSMALRDAFSSYSGLSASGEEKDGNSKRLLNIEESGTNAADEHRTAKRCRTDRSLIL